MELAKGLEPPTHWLQINRSTNWAIPAHAPVFPGRHLRGLWSKTASAPRMCRPMLERGIFLPLTGFEPARTRARPPYLLSYKGVYTRSSRVCASFKRICSLSFSLKKENHKFKHLREGESFTSLSIQIYSCLRKHGRSSRNRTQIRTIRAL